MTTTLTRAGRHVKPPRLRLSTMEVLGFIDTPSVTTYALPTSHRVSASPRDATPNPSAQIAEIGPNEFGDRFTSGDVRWGLLATIGVSVTILMAIGLYVLNRPTASPERSRIELREHVAALSEAIEAVQELTPTLLQQDPDNAALGAALLSLEAQTRNVFEAASTLGPEDADVETSLVGVTGELMGVHRLLSETMAQRSAVLSILAGPSLETDPGLIGLEEAASTFAGWQTRFDSVRSALPEDSSLAEAMSRVSARLGQLQRDYLDGLADDSPSRATQAVESVGNQLSEVEAALSEVLSTTVAEVDARLASIGSELDSLFG